MSNDSQSIPKIYESGDVEDRIYAAWEKSGFFTPENLPDLKNRTEHFSIVLPPPNVTGTLHMGHAVMLAIEDAMVRFARMRGKRTLWIPGTDHAAIATQTKVENILFKEEGKTRHDIGREQFLKRVEDFAQQSRETIINQVRKMGASVDWTREAYTLDEERHTVVNTAFKRMFEDGLIYRGHRVINWDPVGRTTVSDDEIVYKETTGTLYTFRYSKDLPIAISTTRPETKVGDTAIAVHPDDKRYKEFVGKTFKIDFAGTELSLEVVADKAVDAEFGTGAVGVTPAHSVVDAEIAKRHDLPMKQVIGEDAGMTQEAGGLTAGVSTIEARKRVVEWLKEHDLLEEEKDIEQNISTAERSGGVIEPLPKLQWFVDVNKEFSFQQSESNPVPGLNDGETLTLKKLMQHVVREDVIEIIPERFEKTYFHWIDNLRDWNISRQIWFGHRVPVWYHDNKCIPIPGRESEVDQCELIVVSQEKPTCEHCQADYTQDPDTLDTWFSSGLWTFSTLGWPEESEDLKTFHPTSVLETGYDILFFWVARMILMSTYLVGEVPFKQVYLHGLVRDEDGRKMSKSLDNIIDPLEMISKYGADATRLSLLVGQTPGNDTKLSVDKVAGFRNFTNKLWNMSRFVFMNVGEPAQVETVEAKTLADRWILGRLSEVTEKVTKHHEAYEFSALGETLRDFSWAEFADWYLEIAKVQLADERLEKNTKQILLYVLERLLKLWHPFMPFVTEEIYKRFDAGMLIVAGWPSVGHKLTDEDRKRFAHLREVVTAVRNIRAQYRISPKGRLSAIVVGAVGLDSEGRVVSALAGLEEISFKDELEPPEGSARSVVGETQVYVPLKGVVDFEKERERLEKKLAEAREYVQSLTKKLANKQFVNNAPDQVVQKERDKLTAAQERTQTLEQEIQRLP